MTRSCFRKLIPEIAVAAEQLRNAVTAHLGGRKNQAIDLFRATNSSIIREWTESLWGAKSPYVTVDDRSDMIPHLPKEHRVPVRMPNAAEKKLLIQRDGYCCRFCGMPLVRRTVRIAIHNSYPEAVPWGRKNTEQHAALQAMWLQYDHVVPHARGGDNSLANIAIACAPCNFARMNYLLEEVGISDPFSRNPVRLDWNGLEEFLARPK